MVSTTFHKIGTLNKQSAETIEADTVSWAEKHQNVGSKKILTFGFCSSTKMKTDHAAMKKLQEWKKKQTKGGGGETETEQTRERRKLVSDVWNKRYFRQQHCQQRQQIAFH